MMKNILIIAFLSSFSWGFTQNLSLNELISLRTIGLDDVEIMLNEKGWEYTKDRIQKEDAMTTLEFTYNTTSTNFEKPAYIHRYFSPSDEIGLHFFSQNKYLEYVKAIKDSKAKLIWSKNIKGFFYKVYQNPETTFILTTYTAKNLKGESKPAYKFTILSNATFEKSALNAQLKEEV